MSSIWETISSALTSLSIPMAPGKYITASGVDLPDEFIVYTLVSSPPEQHADNVETMRSYLVQISYFNRDGLAEMPDIRTAMKSAGFMRGAERDLPYDEVTRHFGLALEFVYIESED